MSMKPLEPGCLALVIGGFDLGTTVHCVERVPPGFKFRIENGEKLETPDYCWIVDEPNDAVPAVRLERHLVRIDGGEDEELQVEDEQEVSA